MILIVIIFDVLYFYFMMIFLLNSFLKLFDHRVQEKKGGHEAPEADGFVFINGRKSDIILFICSFCQFMCDATEDGLLEPFIPSSLSLPQPS